MDALAPDDDPAVVVGSRAHLVKTEAVVKVCVLVVSCRVSGSLIDARVDSVRSFETSSCTDFIPSSA